jgi:D-glycero-D-manno-heptose 1,7-bisphosphate phosphatase
VRTLGPHGAVFLDRDGTINVKAPEGDYITEPSRLGLLPGAAHAIRRLNDRGVPVIVVTNQRGIALGRMTEADLDDVHARLRLTLRETAGARLDAIFHCPHDADTCLCRKPLPGLIYQAQSWRPEIDLTQSIIIGDARTDAAAGARAGLGTILLGDDAGDLAGAVDRVLSTTRLAASTRFARQRGLPRVIS